MSTSSIMAVPQNAHTRKIFFPFFSHTNRKQCAHVLFLPIEKYEITSRAIVSIVSRCVFLSRLARDSFSPSPHFLLVSLRLQQFICHVILWDKRRLISTEWLDAFSQLFTMLPLITNLLKSIKQNVIFFSKHDSIFSIKEWKSES